MSEQTENLALPYIMPSQAQKHVTHNEAVRMLDAIVQLSVQSDTDTSPPTSPEAGARFIIGAGATGDWSGKENHIAAWQDGAWAFFMPQSGWLAYVMSRRELLVFDGQSWTQASGGMPESAGFFGINTSADTTNRLAAKSDAVLFSHDDVTPGSGDVRFTVNKASSDRTGSVLFQSGWSGRAEMGLSGGDDFTVKVSGDGANWQTAMRVEAASGKPDFPALNLLEGFALNLYPDAGRFDGGNGSTTITNGAFTWPAYLQLYGGATAVSGGMFRHNNSSHGGTADPLSPSVDALISKIRSPSHRRYGVEVHIAEITSGTADLNARSFNDETLYLAMLCRQRPQPPRYTFHIYARAIDGTLGIGAGNSQTIIRDGDRLSPMASTFLVAADGWVSLALECEFDPYFATGYQPYPIGFYTANAARWQIACPALMGGLTKVDPNIGVIAPMTGW